MMQQQFKISFSLRTSRKTKTGYYPIQARVSLNELTKRFATGQKIALKDWNEKSQRASKTSPQDVLINTSLDAIQNRLTKSYFKVMNKDYFDINDLMSEYYGKPVEKEHTLLELVKKHNDDFQKRIDIDRTASTYQKYTITEMRLKSFLKSELKRKDIALKALKISFVKDFSLYLQRVFKNKQNTVAKNVKNLKHIITYGIEMDWLDKNPFIGYKYAYKETPQAILTQEELDNIETTNFQSPRLERVKKLFLFQCYTGLAYVDMAKLTHANIVKGNDGNQWLSFSRTKSKIAVRVPLLSKAAGIINELRTSERGQLLPVYANQNMNMLLKEIAAICGIDKNLSTHVGRRTFATTICLLNEIPLITVSKLLGHSNITITQVYAKVVDKKISDEMQLLENFLKTRANKKD